MAIVLNFSKDAEHHRRAAWRALGWAKTARAVQRPATARRASRRIREIHDYECALPVIRELACAMERRTQRLNRRGRDHAGTPLVIVGPQGCGKTRHADELQRHFAARRVVDPWDGEPLERGDLALTNRVPPGCPYPVLRFEDIAAGDAS